MTNLRCKSALLFLVGIWSLSDPLSAPADMSPTPARPASIEQINAAVANMEKQISAGKLPSLDVNYSTPNPTEGVPPSFKFFFDPEDAKLLACKIHVGHEVWAADFNYYFDTNEVPLKYRAISSNPIGSAAPDPAPLAIIYGSKGEILWKNVDSPRMSPHDILKIFEDLRWRLDKFS